MANSDGFRLPLEDGFVSVERLKNGKIVLTGGDAYFGITRIYVTVEELRELAKSLNALLWEKF